MNKTGLVVLGVAATGIGIAAIAKSRQSLAIPPLEENPTAEVVTYACPSCGYSFVGYQEAEGMDVLCPRCGEVMLVTGISAQFCQSPITGDSPTQVVVLVWHHLPYELDIYLGQSFIHTVSTVAAWGAVAVGATAFLVGAVLTAGQTFAYIQTPGFEVFVANAFQKVWPVMVGALVYGLYPGFAEGTSTPCGVIMRFALPVPIPLPPRPQICQSSPEETATVTVNVYGTEDWDRPIRAMIIFDTGQSAASDDGVLVVHDVPVGWHSYVVYSPGYLSDGLENGQRIQVFENDLWYKNQWSIHLDKQSYSGSGGPQYHPGPVPLPY